jgi:hypothetical protein
VSGQLHTPAVLTPEERAPGIHWIGSWVGPRTGLNDMERRKILPRDSHSDPSAVQPVASRLHQLRYPGSFFFLSSIIILSGKVYTPYFPEELFVNSHVTPQRITALVVVIFFKEKSLELGRKWIHHLIPTVILSRGCLPFSKSQEVCDQDSGFFALYHLQPRSWG